MAKREHTIKRRLSLSYIIYIILFILFVGIITNVIIQNQFTAYAKNRNETEIKELVTEINAQANNSSAIALIGTNAVHNGYVVTVFDQNGHVVWDAATADKIEVHSMMADITARMKAHFLEWNGKYVTGTYPLTNGSVQIGYMSPYFYTEDDLNFLSALNTLYLISCVIFIVAAFALAGFMAKRLSRPLEKIVQTTGNIARGIYDVVPKDQANIKEINELARSVNTLSSTLKEEDNARKMLASDITHELRTPLSALQAHIEAMIDGVIAPDETELKNIYEEIIRLGRIVSDLDLIARFDVNYGKLNQECLDLSVLVENVVNMYKMQYDQKKVELIYEKKPLMSYTDKDKMSQVMVNLLSNALKYTPEGKSVEVITEEYKYQAVIIVKDTGEGIDPSDLPHIFERFYRADRSRARQTGGSGIGLTIVKTIVQAHGGKITAESTIGKGTTIRIELPKGCI